ncbi:hypothetical protein [Bacillus marasmi]|uniref:hypothetical protein n=1 Tax=Bacillus marasmi TaxID=1926279 RepID=UPI0011CBA24F|nr:hypothetical protein [Bacillus marasmi]
MTQLPPFHPEWLIRFWFNTPGLQLLNPHWVLIILALVGIALFFIKRSKTADIAPVRNQEEEQFQHLLTRKQIIERKIAELENQKLVGELTAEKYEIKLGEYKKHLDKVNLDLAYYT